MSNRRSGPYRRPGNQKGSRAIRAQAARLRTERDTRPRRVDATVTPDGLAMRTRAGAVLILFCVVWVLLVARAGWLTVGPAPRLNERLAGQHERVIEVAPQRGSIVDRMGRPLAVSVELDSLFADPSMVEDSAAAAELLSPLLDVDAEGLKASLSRDDTRFVWLGRQVSRATADAVRELDIPGVRITAEAHREYPSGALAGPILGFVGTEGQGLEGLEARFDSRLMGDTVQYRIVRDGRRRTVNYDAVLSRRSTEGDTLVLTLDHSIQHRAEVSLAAAVDKYDARAGWLVMIDVQTGGIVAMTSSPSFDPNHFRGVDPARFRSRAIAEVYEPGSVMKPFVVAEVLERGLATLDEKIYCEKGAYRIGRRTVHDTHPYAHLTVPEIIQVSSNIGATKLGERMGPAALEETYRRFGFGSKTGLELREEGGILHASSSWSRIGFATHTFGQGMAVTGLQLTGAMASLVNGGQKVQPHLVSEIRDIDGEVVEDRRPGLGDRVISEEVSRVSREMMALVVQKGGTAPKAALDEYSSGGKTGTAQKVKDGRYAKGLYVASFIGFAPVESPRLVTLVVLDEPKGAHYGGTVAAPVFKEVMTHALRELGVPPDKEIQASTDKSGAASEPVGVAALVVPEVEVDEAPELDDAVVMIDEGTWEMPNLKGRSLRDAVRILGPLGVDLELAGNGLVVQQTPIAGGALPVDGTVRLALALRAAEREAKP